MLGKKRIKVPSYSNWNFQAILLGVSWETLFQTHLRKIKEQKICVDSGRNQTYPLSIGFGFSSLGPEGLACLSIATVSTSGGP